MTGERGVHTSDQGIKVARCDDDVINRMINRERRTQGAAGSGEVLWRRLGTSRVRCNMRVSSAARYLSALVLVA